MKRVVVTGATGAIGMALLDKLIKENIEVVVLVNPGSHRNEILPEHMLIHKVECGISDYGEVDINKLFSDHGVALDGFDTWYHLAWMGASGPGRNDTILQLKNVEGLLKAIELAEKIGCKTFVGAGSQAEYGPSNQPLGENSNTNPIMGYGIAKLCAGKLGRLKAEQLGIKFIWTRIFSVYGPFDGENTMIMSGIRSMLNGDVPGFTKGEQQWDYLFSRDAAGILYRLSEVGEHGRIYPIGRGKTKALSMYIETICNVMKNEFSVEAKANLGAVSYGENQVMFLCADLTSTLEAIGDYDFTPFDEGIKETIEWYKNKNTRREDAGV